ncbi:MAG: hypothetical protein D6807_06120 [Alphaproteobacteria bacterium]|nr:MAG: hypothetical protein D6807_06120 [Alphaproteobacteria bacterium]
MASIRTALGDFMDSQARVRALTGKPVLRQLREIRRFRKEAILCGATDYYRFGIYDPDYVPRANWPTYLGWRDQRGLSLALNPRRVSLPGWDKLCFYALARNLDIPLPTIRACFQPGTRATASWMGCVLGDVAALRRFLLEDATWPLFVKPSWGGEGIRTLRLEGLDRAAGRLILHGGRTMEIETFLHWCTAPSDRWHYRAEQGLLFQEVLAPDPQMATLFRLHAVPSLRIVSLVGAAGEVVIHRVVAKIPLGDNVIDNFALGRTGNMAVLVDIASGRFGHGLRGILPTGEVERAIGGAPSPFLGAAVPHWEAALDIVARGATAFPLMRIQHWDIALTDRGPVALELNDLGGTEILQIHGIGLLTAPLREHVRRYGDPAVRSWVAALRA